MAFVMNKTHGLSSEDEVHQNTLLKAVQKIGRTVFGNPTWKREKDKDTLVATTDRSIDGFSLSFETRGELVDVHISELAKSIKEFPQGDDRGVLSAAIELIQSQPFLDRKLSELLSLVPMLSNVPQPAPDRNLDVEARERWLKRVKEGHKPGGRRAAPKAASAIRNRSKKTGKSELLGKIANQKGERRAPLRRRITRPKQTYESDDELDIELPDSSEDEADEQALAAEAEDEAREEEEFLAAARESDDEAASGRSADPSGVEDDDGAIT